MSLTKVPNSMLVSPGGGGDTPAYQQTLLNNQTSPANLTDAIVSSSTERMFDMDFYISRIYNSTTEAIDSAWVTNASSGNKFSPGANTIALQPDGKLLVSGTFTDYNGVSGRDHLVRLNTDGTLDTDFCNNASDGSKFSTNISRLVLQPDGKIIVCGGFINYGGITGRNLLVRLNSDGTVDETFCTNASDGPKFNTSINALALQPDGKILVGGGFVSYGGTSGRNRLIRLNADGTLDTAFCINATDGNKFTNNNVCAIEVQSDGKIIVAGSFSIYNGFTGRRKVVRLTPEGNLDVPFCNNAVDGNKFGASDFGSLTGSVLELSDGRLLFSSLSSDYAGISGLKRMVCLNNDGTINTLFCNNAIIDDKFSAVAESVTTFFEQPDGKILIAGSFSSYSGITGLSNMIRVNTDGSLDTIFSYNVSGGAKFGLSVTSIAMDTETNSWFFCGTFQNYNGVSGDNRVVKILSGLSSDVQSVGNIKGSYFPTTNAWYFNSYDVPTESGITLQLEPAGQITYTSTDLPGTEVESLIKYKINKI